MSIVDCDSIYIRASREVGSLRNYPTSSTVFFPIEEIVSGSDGRGYFNLGRAFLSARVENKIVAPGRSVGLSDRGVSSRWRTSSTVLITSTKTPVYLSSTALQVRHKGDKGQCLSPSTSDLFATPSSRTATQHSLIAHSTTATVNSHLHNTPNCAPIGQTLPHLLRNINHASNTPISTTTKLLPTS